jgi:Ca2+-binding EF-hand superfamily protein
LKKVELQALMKFYDINGDGLISYDEFLNGLRIELSPRRAKMVEKVLQQLDPEKKGVI